MATKRKNEVFSAGCPACQETIDLVDSIACSSCEISVLADCCASRGPNEATLRAAGLGQPGSRVT